MAEPFEKQNIKSEAQEPEKSRPIYFIHESAFVPPSDVWETEERIIILMEIARLDLKKLNITYQGGYLIIEGERNEPEFGIPEKMVKIHKKEIEYGQFRIRVKMNTRIQARACTAEYQDGMLKIILPKDLQIRNAAGYSIPVKVLEESDTKQE